MSEVAKDAGWLIWIGLTDLLDWATTIIRRQYKLLVHTVLCGMAGLITWMSFDAANYSRRDSLILFVCAIALFLIGIKPITDSRLFNVNHDA